MKAMIMRAPGLTIGLAVLAGILPFGLLSAATINVAPDGLVNPCHLREAIQAANTDTTYGGACTAGSGTDTLVLLQYDNYPVFTPSNLTGSDEDANASGDLDITSAIIIQGVNPELSIIKGPSFDRAFDVRPSGALTLNDVTVIGGSVIGATGNDGGVVRKISGGTLTINRSVLRGGTADFGGGIYAQGTGVVTLDKVSIFDNYAGYGGGISLQQSSGVEAVLNNVTISGNLAGFSAGGLYASSWFRMRNSTVASNRSPGVGGIQYGAATSTTGVNFANSLLVDNVNGNGDASDLYCSGSTGNNQLGARSYTMIGAVVNCTFASFVGIPASADARLSPLFDFGSGRPTHALLRGSAALAAGNPSSSNPLSTCLSTDARSISRSQPCDLGAYEERIDVTVNSFSDFPDLNPGDGVCQANGNVCTLRALAMEASVSGGRWFVNVPTGTYTLNRAFDTADDAVGGDLDIKRNSHDNPLQLILMGMGDAGDTRIVGGGFDRVLEVRGRSSTGPTLVYVNYPLAFALFNATLSGGDLSEDPFAQDPNAQLEGGGIRVVGGKTLFYNVVVKDNYVESLPPSRDSVAAGIYLDTRSTSAGSARIPYASSSRLDRFAIVDNATTVSGGGYGKRAGGLYAVGSSQYDISDGITLNNGTIAGNLSRDGGGVMLYGVVDASFLSIVDNVSGPLAPPGFTRYAGGATIGGQENRMRHLLLSGNLAGTEASDCEVYELNSSLVSLGYNLIADTGSSCYISGDTSTNQLNVDPQLDGRMTYAGMPYYAPAAASPAVDAIPRGACNNAGDFSVSLDALGSPRRSGGNPSCDIGAIEVSELPIFADGFEG
jgi:hypothetical protein